MSHYAFNWFAVPPFLTAVSSLAVGLILLRRERTSSVGRALFLVTATISVWFGASAVMFCTRDVATAFLWIHLEYVAVPFVPAAIYLYIAVGLRLYDRQRLLVWALFVIAIAFAGIALATNLMFSGVEKHWWGYYPAYGPAGPFFVGFFAVLIVFGVLQPRSKLREAPKGSLFHQRISMSLFAFLAISVGAVDFFAKFGVPIYPFGYLAVLAFLATILVLERRHRVVYMTPAIAASQILATMQGAILVANPEGALEMVNQAACELLGYGETELLQLSGDDVFASETESQYLLRNCLAGQGVHDRETFWRRRDGGEIDVSVSASVVTDGGGQPLGVIFSGLEITSRKQMEAALRLSEGTLRAILECVQVGIVIIDPETHVVTSVNSAGAKMVGATSDEIVGKGCHNHICPAEVGKCPITDLGQAVDNSERALLKVDGTRIAIIKTVVPLVLAGRPHLVETFIDISKRKATEEELASEKERLALLNQAAVELSHCLVASDVHRTGIRLACEATGADGGVIRLLPSSENGRVVESAGLTRKGRAELLGFVGNSPAAEMTPGEQTQTLLSDADLLHGQSSSENTFAGALLTPVVSRGKVMEVLCLGTAPGRPSFSAADCALAEGIAALMSVASENARLYDHARYLAQRDPVTDLLNHREINARLEKELARTQRTGGSFVVVMTDLDNFKLFNDTYGHVVGDQVLQHVSTILKKSVRRGDIVGRYGGDEFVALLANTDARGAVSTVERIRKGLHECGYLVDGGSRVPVLMSYGLAAYPFDGRHASELLAAADANLYLSKRAGGDCITAPRDEAKLGETKTGMFTVLDGLVTSVDNKDHYTRKHSDDVCECAVALASELGLSAETQRCVRVAALLHDVGKIGIPDHILRKPGSLTEEEYEVIKQHVSLGELIIKEIPNLSDVLGAVSSHHERYDGKGYPRGLKGKEIPLLGRVLAVADAYSAMTTDRPYREGFTPEDARAELLKASGTQLDPRVVSAFLVVLDDASRGGSWRTVASESAA